VLVPAAVVGLIAVRVQVSYIQNTAVQSVSYPWPEPRRQGPASGAPCLGFGEPL
jgi:hypothetical protein